MADKAPSSGKSVALALAGGGTSADVFLYFAHKIPMFADMPATVGAGIVFLLGSALVGLPMHITQRNAEQKASAVPASTQGDPHA